MNLINPVEIKDLSSLEESLQMIFRMVRYRKELNGLKLMRRRIMRIYLVRHGETDWNRERKVQGSVDIPLNDYGIYLAEETAKGLKDVKFDIAYTSPLIRARKTAEVILEGRNIPIIDEPAIQEVNFGAYEGMCISGVNKAPESAEFTKFFSDTGNFVPAKDGESVEGLLERTGHFLEELIQKEELEKKTILLSTHGAAMTALLNCIKGNLEPKNFWVENVPPNCGVTIVDVINGQMKITEENLVFYKEPVRVWKVDED